MTDDTPQPEPPKFAEVYGKGKPYPAAKAVQIDDILDKTVVIEEYVLRPSKFPGRQVAIIHGHSKEVNPQEPYDFSVATGSSVVLQQLEDTKSLMPYRAMFVKFKNYYKLV